MAFVRSFVVCGVAAFSFGRSVVVVSLWCGAVLCCVALRCVRFAAFCVVVAVDDVLAVYGTFDATAFYYQCTCTPFVHLAIAASSRPRQLIA